MLRLRCLFAVLVALLLSSGFAHAAPAYVSASSSNNTAANGSSTVTITLGSAIPAGAAVCIFAGFASSAVAADLTVTDNASGNTYTELDFNNPGSFGLATFYGLNIQNSPTTITFSSGSFAMNFSHVFVETFTGVATTSALDVHAINPQTTAPGTGANAVTSGNVTTTANGDLLCGGTVDLQGAGTISHGTSPISYTQAESTANAYMTEYAVQSTASATTPATFTASSASDQFITAIVALKPSVSSSSCGRGTLLLMSVGC